MDLTFEDPLRGYMTTGFLSKHFGPGKFNEHNAGLGFSLENGLMGGYYKNSLGKDSVYLAKEFKTGKKKLGPVDGQLGLILGGATGYGKPVMPIAMPEAILSAGEHAMALGLVPPVKGVTPATLALQYRRAF